MPTERGTCRAPEVLGKACDLKEIARGLCRRHYDEARLTGKLEIKGTGKKGGRPAGIKLATPLSEEWLTGPDRTVGELQAVVRKLAYAILTDPGASQMERTQFAKIVTTMKDEEADEGAKEKFQNLIASARGLTAVPDES